jgi:hypothetical protein
MMSKQGCRKFQQQQQQQQNDAFQGLIRSQSIFNCAALAMCAQISLKFDDLYEKICAFLIKSKRMAFDFFVNVKSK